MSVQRRLEDKSSRTAAYTCTYRASSYLEKEIHYKSDDYIAVKLLPRFVKLLLKLKILNLKGRLYPKGIYLYVIARTKYIDSVFGESIKKGYEQILIMGAGFDSRAIRFINSEESNVKVYETDTYYTQEAKIKQLEKRGVSIPANNIYISIDFNKEDLRNKLGEYKFELNKKTLFIIEGITMYLS